MDVRFINPFIASIKHVFATMVHTEVTAGKPLIKPSETHSADVSGVIGLSGDITGAVVLSFPAEVACKLASKFAGVELSLDHPDFADAVGELANMVAGNAKKDLGGHDISISLPSVIIGRGHQVSQMKTAPTLIIPCHTRVGGFDVEVAMLVHKKRAAQAEAAAVGAQA